VPGAFNQRRAPQAADIARDTAFGFRFAKNTFQLR
jgi:hypothetical protein